MNLNNIDVKRVDSDNYHKFDDMVFWRINDKERTVAEKDISRQKPFDDIYLQLNNLGYRVYVVSHNNRFIGWISLIYVPKIGNWISGVLYVDELWVAPNYRKNGIGSMLMQKAHDYKEELKATKIRLYTGIDNFAAQNLYKKYGLKIVPGKNVFMETENPNCRNIEG